MKSASILVIGGSGFVGRHLVAALAEAEALVAVPARRRERAKHLILLPTVEVIEDDVNRRGALIDLVAGRDAVINLVGILHGPGFAAVHAELPQAIVEACRVTGVKRLLHMSALGAAPDAPSEYLRTKAAGEQAVLEATDLAVTVFRPSVIFGPEDRFLNLFATLARYMPLLALACPDARFQPVYVGDVVRAFCAALDDGETHGKRYDLCGPTVYALRELVEGTCEMTGRKAWVVGLSDRLSYLQARAMELLPVKLLTRDNYLSMQVPSVCECPFPFGIQPTALEAVAPAYLASTSPRDRYPEFRFKARR